MSDLTEPHRRAMALVSAVVDGDDAAVQALRPADSPAVAHLWNLDPLAAAEFEPEEAEARHLFDAAVGLILLLVEAAHIDRDELRGWLGRRIAELSFPEAS